MKHAVIKTGGKQYVVKKDDVVLVEKLIENSGKVTFDALMVFDDKDTKIGDPVVKGSKVTADVLQAEQKGEKIVVRKYKAKKRINKVQGHRQKHTALKITAIS